VGGAPALGALSPSGALSVMRQGINDAIQSRDGCTNLSFCDYLGSYRPYQVHTLFFYTRSYEPAFEMLALALTADLEGYLASRIVGSLATDWPVE
jgi:hypothetical protein